jgi:hypothetical protein
MPFLRQLECYEMGSQPVDSIEAKIGKNENMTLPHTEEFRNASGRPRTHSSDAEKQRAYRARKAQEPRASCQPTVL